MHQSRTPHNGFEKCHDVGLRSIMTCLVLTTKEFYRTQMKLLSSVWLYCALWSILGLSVKWLNLSDRLLGVARYCKLLSKQCSKRFLIISTLIHINSPFLIFNDSLGSQKKRNQRFPPLARLSTLKRGWNSQPADAPFVLGNNILPTTTSARFSNANK